MNQLILQGQVLELGLIRYTPAGLAALDCSIKHASEVPEAGKPRKVSMEIKAVAIGDITKALLALGVGGVAVFRGFITNQRNGRGIIFHVTELQVSTMAQTRDVLIPE